MLNTPMINNAKVAKITNLTKIKTKKEKEPRRAPKCPAQERRSALIPQTRPPVTFLIWEEVNSRAKHNFKHK